MKLGHKVATIALVSSLAVTGAFAFGMGNGDCFGQGVSPENRQMMMQQRGMGYGMMGQQRGMGYGMMGHHGGGMMFLRGLDLTADQMHEVSILRDEMRLEMKKSMDPTQRKENAKKIFGADKFDKEAFLKNSQERFESRVAIKAKYMEKIYNILTPEQRKQVSKNIDTFQPMGWRQ